MRPKREFTVPSETVQGPGTWVIFRRLTWGEVKPYLGKNMLDKVAAQIVEWNWTDDDGQALPLPKSGADLEQLLSEETAFLLNSATSYDLSPDEAKN